MAKLTRKRTILVGSESGYGTGVTLTGSSNALLVRDLEITPLSSETVERNLIRSYMGGYDTLLANTHVAVSFEVELTPSGTAGTAPAFDPALRACGFNRTDVSSTSNTYAPISTKAQSATTGYQSCTIWVNYDGVLHKMAGCYGTFSINLEVGQIPTIRFEMMGQKGTITDTALPTCTYTQPSPLIFKDDNCNATPFTFFGSTDLFLKSWSLDMGVQVSYVERVGAGGNGIMEITDRAATGNATFDMETIACKDLFTVALGNSTGSNIVKFGTSAGSKIDFSCPQTSISQPTYSDDNGIQMLDCPFSAVPSSSGNDEVSIKFY